MQLRHPNVLSEQVRGSIQQHRSLHSAEIQPYPVPIPLRGHEPRKDWQPSRKLDKDHVAHGTHPVIRRDPESNDSHETCASKRRSKDPQRPAPCIEARRRVNQRGSSQCLPTHELSPRTRAGRRKGAEQ